MKPLDIVFMGTPEFALPALDLLYVSPHRLVGLVTRPDSPRGRGRRLCSSAVGVWARERSVDACRPGRPCGADFMGWLKEKNPDLVVTVAYGRLLPGPVLDYPRLGCINLHASYLPAYRGAAPIHRAIIDGAASSGVTVIRLVSELDAGPIIAREKEEISFDDTAGMLHDRLAARGAALLLEAVNTLARGEAVYTEQEHRRATYAPPLAPEEERIDWADDAPAIYNRIRGLNPWPGAYAEFEGRRIKVWKAALPPAGAAPSGREPGTVLAVGENALTVATGRGDLNLLDLQPAGKKKMDAGSFCCGYRMSPGSRLDL